MTKSDLRNGMFGKLSDGDIFVVVNDKMIYENGQLDIIADMDEDMVFRLSGNKIMELYEADCFNAAREGRGKLIWKRTEPKVEEVKSEEGKATVTITEDEFFEIVKEANELFMTVGKEVPGHELADAMMGLQNITFGGVIATVLFGKEIK